MKKIVYLIKNIKQFGFLIAYCIDRDISVFRTYYRDGDNLCYDINFKEKRCFYASIDYYESLGYEIVEPRFDIDEYSKVVLLKGEK